MRQPLQFLINRRHQLLELRLIAVVPGKKQLSNLLGWERSHRLSIRVIKLGRERRGL